MHTLWGTALNGKQKHNFYTVIVHSFFLACHLTAWDHSNFFLSTMD